MSERKDIKKYMPALSATKITQAIIDAFDQGNASATFVSPRDKIGNPRRFIVQYAKQIFDIWIYAWTLTHGGGSARPKNEYRIQITGVQSPLLLNPHGITLLVGYEPDTSCFAGFDVTKHISFSTKSPSIQIPITNLHDALQNGLSFTRKGNEEIAIGIRDDQFLVYALNASLFHREGASSGMPELLQQAVELQDIAPEDIGRLSEERVRVIQEVNRYSRDSTFRKRVITAYERRCAVTRMQLQLIDAAHILPVGVEGSTDETANGLCLSPTYHRAFDRALIFLDDDLRMRINPQKEAELIRANMHSGLDEFKSYLGKRIHLPYEKALWPKLDYIQQANAIRDITKY